jgi:hypothetical protein
MTALYRLTGVIGPGDDVEDLYLESPPGPSSFTNQPTTTSAVDGATPIDFDSFDATLRATVAHEFVHASKMSFDLPRCSAAPPATSTGRWPERRPEGDATHHERLWRFTLARRLAVLRRTVSGGSIPAALEREFRFPTRRPRWASLVGAMTPTRHRSSARRPATHRRDVHPQLASAAGNRVASCRTLPPRLEEGRLGLAWPIAFAVLHPSSTAPLGRCREDGVGRRRGDVYEAGLTGPARDSSGRRFGAGLAQFRGGGR